MNSSADRKCDPAVGNGVLTVRISDPAVGNGVLTVRISDPAAKNGSAANNDTF